MNPAHEKAIRAMLKLEAPSAKERQPLPPAVVKNVEAAERYWFNAMHMHEMRFDVLAAILAISMGGEMTERASGEPGEAEDAAGKFEKGEPLTVLFNRKKRNAKFHASAGDGTIEVAIEGDSKPTRYIPLENVERGVLEAVEA